MRKRRCRKEALRLVVLVVMTIAGSMQTTYAGTNSLNSDSGFAAAILSTLENHPSMAGQTADIEAKEHAMAEARSLRLPSLSGQLGQPLDYDNSSSDSLVTTLLLRQPVWTFGRISRELDYARTDRDTELAAAHSLRRDLAERTGTSYARVLGASRSLTASKVDTETLEDLVNQIRRRAQARLASAADVALAEARLVQMHATQMRLRTELTLAEAELLALTQRPITVDSPVPEQYTVAEPLAQLEVSAIQNAPSLLRSERLVELARAEAARERSNAYPTIYLEGRQTFGDEDNDQDLQFGIIVEGALDGLGLVRANRTRALDAGARSAAAELDLARTELERRIRTLHASRASRSTLINGYTASIEKLEEVLGSFQRQYEAGRKEWLELLNLYREVAELHLQLEQARTDWTTDSIALVAASGQLDDFPNLENLP